MCDAVMRTTEAAVPLLLCFDVLWKLLVLNVSFSMFCVCQWDYVMRYKKNQELRTRVSEN